MATTQTLTKIKARKVLKVVDAGLVSGLGDPKPGEMCVMAALNYALGFDHGDQVDCVHPVVRELDIALNDSNWSSKTARAKGMRREAIAKLGSANIDAVKYMRYVALYVVKEILPALLRETKLEKNAKECEAATDLDAARNAASAASAASDAARYAASDAARYAASDAARAASAASDAARYAASDAARYAASAASYAASAAARYAASDKVLCQLADISTRALIECGSQGSKWLDICEE